MFHVFLDEKTERSKVDSSPYAIKLASSKFNEKYICFDYKCVKISYTGVAQESRKPLTISYPKEGNYSLRSIYDGISICIAQETQKTDNFYVTILAYHRLSTSSLDFYTVSFTLNKSTLVPSSVQVSGDRIGDVLTLGFVMESLIRSMTKTMNALYDVSNEKFKCYVTLNFDYGKSSSYPKYYGGLCDSLGYYHMRRISEFSHYHYFVSPSIVKMDSGYWTYVYGDHRDGGTGIYRTPTHWNWIFIDPKPGDKIGKATIHIGLEST